MGFHDVTLSSDFIGYGSEAGPGHRTFVPDSESGVEQSRQKRWGQSRRRYSLVNDIDETQLRELFEFVLCRRGSSHSFLIRDPNDYTTASDHKSASAFDDVVIGIGDGSKTEFTLSKLYEAGGSFEIERLLRKPVLGLVQAGQGGLENTIGSDFTIDHQLGRLSFVVAPPFGNITIGCEFRVQVRFGKSVDDLLGISYDTFRTASYTLDLSEDMVPVNAGDRHVPTTDLINYGGGTNFLSTANAPLVSPFFLSFNDGMFVEMNPTSVSTVRLPDINTDIAAFGPASLFSSNTVIPGGRYFVIYNSGSANITVEEYRSGWATIQASGIVRPDEAMEIFVDDDGFWRGR